MKFLLSKKTVVVPLDKGLQCLNVKQKLITQI